MKKTGQSQSKELIIFSFTASQRHNRKKCRFPPVSSPPYISIDRGLSPAEGKGEQNKRFLLFRYLYYFMDPVVGERKERKASNGKILNTELEWRRVSSKPLRKWSWQSHLRGPLNGGVYTRNVGKKFRRRRVERP